MRFLLLLSLCIFTVYSETYEEYLRFQEQAFSSFKEERDKEFSAFLNQEWKAYKEAQGLKAYEVEKPKVLPKAVKQKVVRPKEKVIVSAHVPKVQQQKVYDKIIIPTASKKLETLYLNFFGVDLELHYHRSVLISFRGDVSKNKIADSWDKLARSEYEVTLQELEKIMFKLRLNDWAKYLLIQKVSKGLFGDENRARLFSWFVLLKMGFDAHISFQKHKIVLLLPVKGDLYNTVYYTLNDKRYYAIDYYAKGKLGTIMSYDHVYEGADSGIDFSIEELPLVAEHKIKKPLTFRVNNKTIHINLEYDKNILQFFQTYPQVGNRHYFFSAESITLENSIKSIFEPLILGRNQSEALDILLSFVQNAFKYQVDEMQFGREKVMFPSETLFYPYSDCEDRAIFFSYMVKTLLGLDVVGVKYTNHMVAAVKVQEKIEGEYINFSNTPYLLADPSYKNATMGVSMPQFSGVKSYIIVSTGGEK